MIYYNLMKEIARLVEEANSCYPVDHSTVAKNVIFGVDLLLRVLISQQVPKSNKQAVLVDLEHLAKTCKFNDMKKRIELAYLGICSTQ